MDLEQALPQLDAALQIMDQVVANWEGNRATRNQVESAWAIVVAVAQSVAPIVQDGEPEVVAAATPESNGDKPHTSAATKS